MLPQEHIDEYILLFHKRELSSEQQAELSEWLKATPANRTYFRKMIKLYTCVEISGEENLISRMQGTVQIRLYKQIRSNRRKRFLRRISGAAAIFVVIAGIALLWDLPTPEVAVPTEAFGESGSSKAILTLATSEKISLNKKENKYITTPEGNLMRQDTTGHLHIQASSQLQQTVKPNNTVWVPQGGEYRLTLADGTEVWLNAESKLKFPTQFTGNKRTVELSGDAYFEVTGDTSCPFIIHTEGIEVKVSGTSFGIRSYQEEDAILTTLVSGSVDVESHNSNVRLTPEHQAVFTKKTKDISVKQVNTELYVGWKDGKMIYNNCSLEDILRDLKRWYSFDVFYADSQAGQIPFSLNIRKYEKATRVLELMQKTGRVHFDIKGNTIIVK